MLKHYPNKIERIWFYGITDIDDEFAISMLEDDYIELFSHGHTFYKSQDIILSRDPMIKALADIYVMSYDTLIADAESRNKSFLEVLKKSIQKHIQQESSFIG